MIKLERQHLILKQVGFFLRVNKFKKILNKYYAIQYYSDLKLDIRSKRLSLHKCHSQK
jgi:hypothetical protein